MNLNVSNAIIIPRKATSVNFLKIIADHWDRSFQQKAVTFDLKNTEWIGSQEITLLMAWIRSLINKEILVEAELPSGADIERSSKTFERRQNCINVLLVDWKFDKIFRKPYHCKPNGIAPNRLADAHIPFQHLPVHPFRSREFDLEYADLYERDLGRFKPYMKKVLTNHLELSYFENDFLNYSLLKELYSNTCQHAFITSPLENQESFFSLKVNAPVNNVSGDQDRLNKILGQRLQERPLEEQDFFKTGSGAILNDPYVEISYVDFGDGISTTLKNKYLEDYANKKDLFQQGHAGQPLDTRVLEYAFLLFSSRNEFAENLVVHDFVPRGLYIIRNIVERHGGMIIAKSASGKIVYDFSRGNDNPVRYPAEQNPAFFPGTVITIIFPTEKRALGLRTGATQTRKHETKKKSGIIRLLDLFAVAECQAYKTAAPYQQKSSVLYNNFFTHLLGHLQLLKSNKVELVILDFAGIDRTTFDVYNKLLLFISACPLLDEGNLDLCIVNLVEHDIFSGFRKDRMFELKSKGFYPKAIPCISPDLSTSWIVLNNRCTETDLSEIAAELNSLWKHNAAATKHPKKITPLAGNAFVIEIQSDLAPILRLTIPDPEAIAGLVVGDQPIQLKKEITNNGLQFLELIDEEADINHNDIALSADTANGKRAFLTSNGKFQTIFYSFADKLHIRKYRRYICTHLLLKYSYLGRTTDRSPSHINVIIVLNASSQLLGKEIRELLHQLYPDNMVTLKTHLGASAARIKSSLSQSDRALVINDVIATGNFSSQFYEVLADKKVEIKGLLTILDTRATPNLAHAFLPIHSLMHEPLVKYDENPYPAEPVWINPMLNEPVIQNRQKSSNTLFDPAEFLQIIGNERLFMIGNFTFNNFYQFYHLNLEQLLKEDGKDLQYPFLTRLLRQLNTLTTKQNREKTDRLKAEKRKLILGFIENAGAKYLPLLQQMIDPFLEQEDPDRDRDLQSNFDMILYPYFSSIDELEKGHINSLLQSLNKAPVEIYPLQRSLTHKGWRFSFTPNFLQNRAVDKNILLLDDGSNSGNSVIQLMETIAAHRVRSITVLSIFGRIEDYQLEFFERIKRINAGNRFIPVNIYFGTQFHLPSYDYDTFPGKKELEHIDQFEKNFATGLNSPIPEVIVKYLDYRKKELQNYSDPNRNYRPRGIARQWRGKELFLIRHFLGSYESYRVYKEDSIFTKEGDAYSVRLKPLLKDKQNYEKIIYILYLEPHLIDILRRIDPALLQELLKYAKQELKNLQQSPYITDRVFMFLELIAQTEPKYLLDIGTLREIVNQFEVYERLYPTGSYPIPQHTSFGRLAFTVSCLLLKIRYYADNVAISKLSLEITDDFRNRIDQAPLLCERFMEILHQGVIAPMKKNFIEKAGDHFGKVLLYFDKIGSDIEKHLWKTEFGICKELAVKALGFATKAPTDEDKKIFCTEYNSFSEKAQRDILHSLQGLMRRLKEADINEFPVGLLDHTYRMMVFFGNHSYLNKFKAAKRPEDYTGLSESLTSFAYEILYPASKLVEFLRTSDADLSAAWQHAAAKFPGHRIEFKPPETPVKIRIHRYSLYELFWNILSNKLTYAREAKGTLTVDIRDNLCKLTFYQNAKFIERPGRKGINLVRKISEIYGGVFETTNLDEYTITITFALAINTTT